MLPHKRELNSNNKFRIQTPLNTNYIILLLKNYLTQRSIILFQYFTHYQPRLEIKFMYYYTGADFTAAKGLCALSKSLWARGQALVLLSPRAPVTDVLIGAKCSVPLIESATDLDAALQGTSQINTPDFNIPQTEYIHEFD